LNAPILPNLRRESEARPFFGRVDAVRGLGAMTVAGYHFSGCCVHGYNLLQPSSWPSASPLQHSLARCGLFLLPGHAFLMAFFVISGLVLRVSLEHGPRIAPAATAKFVISRLFRFYPIVAVVVVVSAASSYFLELERAWSAKDLLGNFLLLDVSMNGHLWALQLELMMVPVILGLYFLERRFGPSIFIAVALATTALAFKPSWAISRTLSINMFAFALGMSLPTIGRRIVVGLSRSVATGWLVACAVVMLLTAPSLGTFSRAGSIVEAYAAAVLVSLLAYRPDLPGLRWLDGRWLRALGSASGSYYVLHMTTVPLATAAAALLVPRNWTAHAPGLVGLVVICIWVLAIAPLMIVVSRLVEMPGIALGRRVIRLLALDRRADRLVAANATRPPMNGRQSDPECSPQAA
jgi:peptidoglycan/LPS O-acetylase OafA/YrhL